MPKKKSANRSRMRATGATGSEPGRRGVIIAGVTATVLVVGGLVGVGVGGAPATTEAAQASSTPASSPVASAATSAAGAADPTGAGSLLPVSSTRPSAGTAMTSSAPGSPAPTGSSSSAPVTSDPLIVGVGPADPKALRVKSIGLDVPLTKVGMAADKTIELPPTPQAVGWYTRSPSPGQVGPAILTGFIRTPSGEGAFAKLGKLGKGQQIVIDRTDGTSVVFQVDEIKLYPKGKFVPKEVYSSTRAPFLRIITMGGTMKPTDPPGNVVIFAHLIQVHHRAEASSTGRASG